MYLYSCVCNVIVRYCRYCGLSNHPAPVGMPVGIPRKHWDQNGIILIRGCLPSTNWCRISQQDPQNSTIIWANQDDFEPRLLFQSGPFDFFLYYLLILKVGTVGYACAIGFNMAKPEILQSDQE